MYVYMHMYACMLYICFNLFYECMYMSVAAINRKLNLYIFTVCMCMYVCMLCMYVCTLCLMSTKKNDFIQIEST